MEPRATDKLLDEHFDQLSDSYSDTELGDHLDGTAWKLRHGTERELRRKRRNQLKAVVHRSLHPSGARLPAQNFLESYESAQRTCAALHIRMPFFMRVHRRVYLKLPQDRRVSRNLEARWAHWFHFSEHDQFARDNIRLWSGEKVAAWRAREADGNSFYMHFKDLDEAVKPAARPWSAEEHAAFLARLTVFRERNWDPDAAWGFFSRAIAGRTGLHCRAYYHRLLRSGVVYDPSYSLNEGRLVRLDSAFAGRRPPNPEMRISAIWAVDAMRTRVAKIVDAVREFFPTPQERSERKTTEPKKRLRRNPPDKPHEDAEVVLATPVAPPAASVAVIDVDASPEPDSVPHDSQSNEAAHDSQQSEAPRKGTRVLSEEVQDLQRNLQAFDGDYWQPMKRYADDGTELKGRETKAQLKQRLAQYKSLRTQRLTQGARPPRAVGASDSDSDDVQVEPQKAAVASYFDKRRLGDSSPEHVPLWARAKRPRADVPRAPRAPRADTAGAGGGGGGGGGVVKRSRRRSDSPPRGRLVPPMRVRPALPAAPARRGTGTGTGTVSAEVEAEVEVEVEAEAEAWRAPGEDISDYEDEEAPDWVNPQQRFPEQERAMRAGAWPQGGQGAVRRRAWDVDVSSALAPPPVPRAEPSIGLAPDKRFEGFPRPIPLDPASWAFLDYSSPHLTSLPALPFTVADLPAMFRTLRDPFSSPDSVLSAITKFVSGEFLMPPAEIIAIQKALLRETQALVTQHLAPLWRVDLAAGELMSPAYKRGAEMRLLALRWMEVIGHVEGEAFSLSAFVERLVDDFFCLFGARPHAASLGTSVSHPLFALWTHTLRAAERRGLLWWAVLSAAWQRHDRLVPGSTLSRREELDEFRWHTLMLSAGALGPASSAWSLVGSLLGPFSAAYALSAGLAPTYPLSSIFAHYPLPDLLATYRRTLLLRLLALARFWQLECGLDGEVSLALARFFSLPEAVHAAGYRPPVPLLCRLPDLTEEPRDAPHDLYLCFLAAQAARAPPRTASRLWREVHVRHWTSATRRSLLPDAAGAQAGERGGVTLATLSALLSQLVVIAPTLPDTELQYLPVRLDALYPPPYATEEDARATLFEALLLLACEMQSRGKDLGADPRGEAGRSGPKTYMRMLWDHLEELKRLERTEAALGALERCLSAVLTVLLKHRGLLVPHHFILVDAVAPFVDQRASSASPPPPAAKFHATLSAKPAAAPKAPKPAPPAAPTRVQTSVQLLALRCLGAALEPVRLDASVAAQRDTARRLKEPLSNALLSTANSLTADKQCLVPLTDALARVLALALSHHELTPSALLAWLDRTFLCAPSFRTRSLPAAIICAVTRETHGKVNLILDAHRLAIGRMWLASLFDPSAYCASPLLQSMPYRFTAIILASDHPGHLAVFPDRAHLAGILPSQPLQYDNTLKLLVKFAEGVATRIPSTPALTNDVQILIQPLSQWLLGTMRELTDRDMLGEYFQFVFAATAEWCARIPVVLHQQGRNTIGSQLFDRFILEPVRGSGREHPLLSGRVLDAFLTGFSRLAFDSDAYVERVVAVGVYARFLSLALPSRLPQESAGPPLDRRQLEQRMHTLARAVWTPAGARGADLRRWFARATAQLLGGAQPPLAFHLLSFVSPLLNARRARERMECCREMFLLADLVAPSIASALNRADFASEAGLQFRRAVCTVIGNTISTASRFVPDADFLEDGAFMHLLRFVLVDSLNAVAVCLGLSALPAPQATAVSISLVNARSAAAAALRARASAPIARLPQLVASAASNLLQPEPPRATLLQLQVDTLRYVMVLFAAASGTPQARAVALTTLADLYELCSLLIHLALPHSLARTLIEQEQRVVGLVGGGHGFRRQSHEAFDVVDVEL